MTLSETIFLVFVLKSSWKRMYFAIFLHHCVYIPYRCQTGGNFFNSFPPAYKDILPLLQKSIFILSIFILLCKFIVVRDRTVLIALLPVLSNYLRSCFGLGLVLMRHCRFLFIIHIPLPCIPGNAKELIYPLPSS